MEFYPASRWPQYEFEWRRIRDWFLSRDFSFFAHVGKSYPRGRKLLLHPLTSPASPSQLHGYDHFLSTSEKLAIGMPIAFFLSCALLFTCFRPKRKAVPPLVVLPKEHYTNSNKPVAPLFHESLGDSLSLLDVSTSSEKFPRSPLRVPPSPLRVPPSPSRFSMSPQLSRARSVHLSIGQILKATQNFSPSLVIGGGEFGTVYKAQLPNGQVVAVKRARKENFVSVQREFSNEVDLVSKIEHRNLVRILGYVDKGQERIIITEYVSNGTLREHLDGQHGKILDFSQRLEISIDVAHALTYLHVYAEKPIIHRDVKSSNILLTENFNAKVTDFGFAKTACLDEDHSGIITNLKGTAGYIDPEYLKTSKLTPKSDVFSFGILLLEILSGRRPVDMKRPPDERITIRWVFTKYTEGNMAEVLDPMLEEVVDEKIIERMLTLAFQCAAPTREDRPTMKETAEKLWHIRKSYISLRRK